MKNSPLSGAQVAWPSSLILATVFGSLALACLFPFAAFAALAALTMKTRSGIALIAAAWAANQALGFFVMSFPWDAQAVGHGIAILAAALAAFGVAQFMVKRGGNIWLRGGAALVAAFAVQQIVLRAYASVGGGAENFSAEIVTAVAVNDALWFAGLLALRFVISQVTGEKAIPAAA